MHWEQLLSLKRQGDKNKRLRKEQDETRLVFEVDYDRIIFSAAFRSLQDKTQVIPLSKTDFVHTRLTHSLEVSVVGRSIGRLVGKKVLEKYPHLQEMHGFQANDFGAMRQDFFGDVQQLIRNDEFLDNGPWPQVMQIGVQVAQPDAGMNIPGIERGENNIEHRELP